VVQDAVAGQTLPQVPQLFSSLSLSTQAPGPVPQTDVPAGHVQLPMVQVAFVGQTVVQSPQCSSSVWKLTHAVGQASGSVPGQLQVLATQTSLVSGQTLRQLPQFDASLVVFTQRGQRRSAQGVALASQPHAAPEQVPRPQDWSQPPQWGALVWVSTHAPPQSVSPVGHSQAPATQEAPVEHGMQPWPQALASVCASTQFPKQRVWPEEHSFSSEGQPRRRAVTASRAAAGSDRAGVCMRKP
jgi:hypothetical protein